MNNHAQPIRRHGEETDLQFRYAGLWPRAAALVLDYILFMAVFFPVTRLVKGVWLMSPQDHRWASGWIVFDPR